MMFLEDGHLSRNGCADDINLFGGESRVRSFMISTFQ